MLQRETDVESLRCLCPLDAQWPFQTARTPIIHTLFRRNVPSAGNPVWQWSLFLHLLTISPPNAADMDDEPTLQDGNDDESRSSQRQATESSAHIPEASRVCALQPDPAAIRQLAAAADASVCDPLEESFAPALHRARTAVAVLSDTHTRMKQASEAVSAAIELVATSSNRLLAEKQQQLETETISRVRAEDLAFQLQKSANEHQDQANRSAQHMAAWMCLAAAATGKLQDEQRVAADRLEQRMAVEHSRIDELRQQLRDSEAAVASLTADRNTVTAALEAAQAQLSRLQDAAVATSEEHQRHVEQLEAQLARALADAAGARECARTAELRLQLMTSARLSEATIDSAARGASVSRRPDENQGSLGTETGSGSFCLASQEPVPVTPHTRRTPAPFGRARSASAASPNPPGDRDTGASPAHSAPPTAVKLPVGPEPGPRSPRFPQGAVLLVHPGTNQRLCLLPGAVYSFSRGGQPADAQQLDVNGLSRAPTLLRRALETPFLASKTLAQYWTTLDAGAERRFSRRAWCGIAVLPPRPRDRWAEQEAPEVVLVLSRVVAASKSAPRMFEAVLRGRCESREAVSALLHQALLPISRRSCASASTSQSFVAAPPSVRTDWSIVSARTEDGPLGLPPDAACTVPLRHIDAPASARPPVHSVMALHLAHGDIVFTRISPQARAAATAAWNSGGRAPSNGCTFSSTTTTAAIDASASAREFESSSLPTSLEQAADVIHLMTGRAMPMAAHSSDVAFRVFCLSTAQASKLNVDDAAVLGPPAPLKSHPRHGESAEPSVPTRRAMSHTPDVVNVPRSSTDNGSSCSGSSQWPAADQKRTTVRFARDVLEREARKATPGEAAPRMPHRQASASATGTSIRPAPVTPDRSASQRETQLDLGGELEACASEDESCLLERERERGRLAPLSRQPSTAGRTQHQSHGTAASASGSIRPMRSLPAGRLSSAISDMASRDSSIPERQPDDSIWSFLEQGDDSPLADGERVDSLAYQTPAGSAGEFGTVSEVALHGPELSCDKASATIPATTEASAAAAPASEEPTAECSTSMKRGRETGAGNVATMGHDVHDQDDGEAAEADETILSHTTVERGGQQHGQACVTARGGAPQQRGPGRRMRLEIQTSNVTAPAGTAMGPTCVDVHLSHRGKNSADAGPGKAKRHGSRRKATKTGLPAGNDAQAEPTAPRLRRSSRGATVASYAEWDAPQEAKTPHLVASARRKRAKMASPK